MAKRKIDETIEPAVAALTRFIHKKDKGVQTSELENAIRIILQEIRDNK